MTNKQYIEDRLWRTSKAHIHDFDNVRASILEDIREHCTDIIIFLAEDYENLKRLSSYELYDLFMKQEIEDVAVKE